ncbi:cytochrome P450 [Altericroceibacterium endophyticum]|uniref:Cytochrome P450 n=1 Tax=Altericroceibacterium endophyticum TaxID=1808508 RepID=A0A6I4T6W0_9SPHN|nr:cytochrome P450 [Altericroceibacterium endophyticum]MXO66676.1 cytochrome P450 [Altericroceibacterium endophyticum]
MSGTARRAPVELGIDPFAETTLRNPGAFDDAALAADSVLYLPKYDLYAVARHEHVKAIFTDWRRYSSAAGTGLTHIGKSGNWRRPSLILENDPPDHARYRKIMAAILTGATLREIRDRFSETADRMAADLVLRGTFDGVKDLAEAFPLLVVPTMLGLPQEARDLMLVYSELNFNSMGPKNEVWKRSKERADPIVAQVMELCQRKHLADDGLGARIYEKCADAGMPEEDAATLVRTFFSASMDTTMNGVGFALQALAQQPAQWATLRENPDLATAAFEESLRYRSPSPYIGRTTVCEVEVDGVIIPADSKVLLLVAAANRDPAKFDRPGEFDLTRNPAGHVAFGVGIHACIGQMVARLEAELALGALARHAKSIELDGTPTYQINNWLRGLSALPLRAEPA